MKSRHFCLALVLDCKTWVLIQILIWLSGKFQNWHNIVWTTFSFPRFSYPPLAHYSSPLLAGWFLLVLLIPSSVYMLIRSKDDSFSWKWGALKGRNYTGHSGRQHGARWSMSRASRHWECHEIFHRHRIRIPLVPPLRGNRAGYKHLVVTSAFSIMFISKYLLGFSGWATHSIICFVGKGGKGA